MAKRQRREYLIYLDKGKAAAETAIDSFNRVNHPYRNETTLILLSNAWELLAKAVLVRARQSITQGHRGETIPAEKAVHRLHARNDIPQHAAETIQQVISLRNAATHQYLPEMPDEIIHHLLYFGCKSFRELIEKRFPSHAKGFERNYLSLSFSDLTTYADKVQKLVSRVKRSESDKRLIWLLERGVEFDGSSYITEKQFESKYRNKKKIMPHLDISRFIKDNEMVRIVAVQAPKNYTADITLRKGSAKDSSLPVLVRKTDIEEDYPFLTKELAISLGTTIPMLVDIVRANSMKGDPKYHQAIRASRSSTIQRYSQAAKDRIREELEKKRDASLDGA